MNLRRCVSCVGFVGFVGVVGLVAGCGAEVERDRVAEDSASFSVWGACSSSPRAYAVYRDGAAGCPDVSAAAGTWRATPAFGGAWFSQAAACEYAWDGEAGPDEAALRSFVGDRGRVARSCAAPFIDPDTVVRPVERPVTFMPMGGAAGCDVCGVVDRTGIIRVILPPEILLPRITVMTSSLEARVFALDVPSGTAAAELALPTLPAGETYLEGHVTVE